MSPRIKICGITRLEDAEAAVQQLAGRGVLVLAVAIALFETDPGTFPAALFYDFQLLLGFADPVRADVPASLEEA